jgi:transcription elongation factor Elf1
MMIEPPKYVSACIHCQSKNIAINHIRKSTGVATYYCNSCLKYFTPSLKIIPKMIYPAEIFDTAIDLHDEGFGSRLIKRKLTEIYTKVPSESRIREWIRNLKFNKRWQIAYKKYERSSANG